LSLLDQIMSCTQGKISHEQVLNILGVIDRKMLYDLAAAILAADIPAVFDLLDDIHDRGHDMKRLHADLLEHFRNLLVAAFGKKVSKLVDLPAGEIEQLVQQARLVSQGTLNQIFDLLFREEPVVRFSPQPKLALEMALVRLLHAKPALPIDVLIDKLEDLRREIQPASLPPDMAARPTHAAKPGEEFSGSSRLQAASDAPETKLHRPEGAGGSVPAPAGLAESSMDNWPQILERIARSHPSLAANLSKCKIKHYSGKTIDIEVPGNGFTLNMIQREKNMAVLSRTVEEISGRRHEIQFSSSSTMEDKTRKKKTAKRLKQKALSHPLVADAIEIFDGKLVDVKII
jgi:DNA polymerase-3 subunit gamma/tau